MGRIKELDGLRAIAILGVLLAHFIPAYSGLSNLLYLGWTGVDLFFALSGFLITRYSDRFAWTCISLQDVLLAADTSYLSTVLPGVDTPACIRLYPPRTDPFGDQDSLLVLLGVGQAWFSKASTGQAFLR